MLISLTLFLATVMVTSSDILDPALFLSPSPPLTTNVGSITPGERWTSSGSSTVTKEAENRISDSEYEDTPTEKPETMENAETFWPKFRTTSYGLSPVHIPLTFSISGTYGGKNPYGTGVIGSSYVSVSADDDDGKRMGFGSYGKSALAGSSYGNYGYPGIRVFSSNSKSGWSGWGNGKWGHYGKG